jgi:hypothetical protein
MRFEAAVTCALVLVLGCGTEGRSRPGEDQAPSAQPALGGHYFEITPDTGAPPAEHASFDRRREEVAPGVARVIISMVVRVHDGRQAVRSAMQRAVDEEVARDSTVAAVRVNAFAAPVPGAGRPTPLDEVATMEWVPLSGWDALTDTSRAAFHRTNTVFHVALPETPMPTMAPGAPPSHLPGGPPAGAAPRSAAPPARRP